MKGPFALGCVVAFTLLAGPAVALDQTIPLQPGWNAIYFEIQPEPDAADLADPACDEPRSPACVFLGLPVASVWHFAPSLGTATFVSSPGVDDLSLETGWLGWFPATSEKSALNTLDEIRVNRAYLVHLEGSPPPSHDFAGRPSFEPMRWTPNAFTLTGFPVYSESQDPTAPVPATFAEFFAGSAAHAEAVDDGLLYMLSSSGVWEPILDATSRTISSGVAYWVFTRGGSDHQGPLEVTPPFGDGLDFGDSQTEMVLRVRKHSGASGSIDFDLTPAGSVPLAYRTIDEVDFLVAGGAQVARCAPTWRDFQNGQSLPFVPCDTNDPFVPLASGEEVVLRLGAVRRDLSVDATGHLEISNGTGVRWRLPLAVKVTP